MKLASLATVFGAMKSFHEGKISIDEYLLRIIKASSSGHWVACHLVD